MNHSSTPRQSLFRCLSHRRAVGKVQTFSGAAGQSHQNWLASQRVSARVVGAYYCVFSSACAKRGAERRRAGVTHSGNTVCHRLVPYVVWHPLCRKQPVVSLTQSARLPISRHPLTFLIPLAFPSSPFPVCQLPSRSKVIPWFRSSVPLALLAQVVPSPFWPASPASRFPLVFLFGVPPPSCSE
jgi:hypothetical protein